MKNRSCCTLQGPDSWWSSINIAFKTFSEVLSRAPTVASVRKCQTFLPPSPQEAGSAAVKEQMPLNTSRFMTLRACGSHKTTICSISEADPWRPITKAFLSPVFINSSFKEVLRSFWIKGIWSPVFQNSAILEDRDVWCRGHLPRCARAWMDFRGRPWVLGVKPYIRLSPSHLLQRP